LNISSLFLFLSFLNGDDDNVLLGGQDLGVVDVERRGPAVEGTTVDPKLKGDENQDSTEN
jgi:hypothetical protein